MNNLNLNLENINNVDLSLLGTTINNNEHKGYFLEKAGVEHYKLIAHISTQFNNSILIDIGTNRGCSSLAMSYNILNKVYSFDLYELKELNSLPLNVNYILDDITNGKYDDLITNSPFIMLDTDHDGTFEHKFHEHLRKLHYKGLLLLDDIHLNKSMKEYWNWISEYKEDISNVGHWSGTGLVYFK